MSKIPLHLNSYDDLFSDFDPRPYAEKALSDDFLVEAKKASKEKISVIDLEFLIPKNKRNLYDEEVIKKRLKEHFKKHFIMLQKEKRNIIKYGAFYSLIGVVLMFIATFVLFRYPEKSLFISFLIVLLEPAGWFLFWEGLHEVIFESKAKTPDFKFYEKMSRCRISFIGH